MSDKEASPNLKQNLLKRMKLTMALISMHYGVRVIASKLKLWKRQLAFVTILSVICPAYAYTTSTCDETWYAPAKGQEFSGSVKSWTKVKEQSCVKHSVNLLKITGQTQDDYTDTSGANESGAFAMVDGSGYYVEFLDVHQGAYCGGGDVPGIDPQCFLPGGLRHNEIHKYRSYYQVSPGRALKLLAADKGDSCGGRYATDGRDVFMISHALDDEHGNFPYTPVRLGNADVPTFKCFVPIGGRAGAFSDWAMDKNRIFFFGREAKGMSVKYPVRVYEGGLASVSDLAINGDKVFKIEFDSVDLVPGVNADIHILSKEFFTDGTAVFDKNFNRIAGAKAGEFVVLMPVCPVPGNPNLACVSFDPKGKFDSSIPVTGGGIGVQNGKIMLPLDDTPSKISIEGVNGKNATYFLVDGYQGAVYHVAPFMLFNGRLYNLTAMAEGLGTDGISIRGKLKSAKCGYVLDDIGAIQLESLTRSPAQKIPDFC